MKIGVIVGRFQTDSLHIGYIDFIKRVTNLNDKVIIIIGVSVALFTDKNPLPGSVVEAMLHKELGEKYQILKIQDHPSDKKWSENLDNLLEPYSLDNLVTLYCSRDGFKNNYYGRYPVIELESCYEFALSTKRRIEIGEILEDSTDFRKGIIYATQNRFPIVYPTVDIVIIKLEVPYCVLVGKRSADQPYFQFPGGFVDQKDRNLLYAADRELSEEAPEINHHGLKYLGSLKINDYRYRGTKDSIMTSVFYSYYSSGGLIAGDDLYSLEWLEFKNENRDKIGDFHKPIWDLLNISKSKI